jgi:hypothetical protein
MRQFAFQRLMQHPFCRNCGLAAMDSGRKLIEGTAPDGQSSALL